LIDRYWEVIGRAIAIAIAIGTLTVEMILQGVDSWLSEG
jgi:hypothetical protein